MSLVVHPKNGFQSIVVKVDKPMRVIGSLFPVTTTVKWGKYIFHKEQKHYMGTRNKKYDLKCMNTHPTLRLFLSSNNMENREGHIRE